MSKKIKPIKVNTDNSCDYGCNKKANYFFKNGKYCCEDEWFRCEKKKKEKSKRLKKLWKDENNNLGSKEHMDKLKNKIKSSWLNKDSKLGSKEHKDKLKSSLKLNINRIKNKYKEFIKIEQLKEENNEIFVKCKYCDDWFKPTYIQLYERIRYIEKPKEGRNAYLFCSSECKNNSSEYYNALRNKELKFFIKYNSLVHKYTRLVLKDYSHKIKNLHLRGNKFGYELDHKYSIYEGFKNNIEPKILAHWCNLEIITKTENLQKHVRCSLNLEDLLSFNETYPIL